MKSIIITGATSMIGAATVAAALAEGRFVAAVVRKSSPHLANLSSVVGRPNLDIIECDIHEYQTLCLKRNYDVFIHMGWQGTNLSLRDDAYCQIDNIRYTIDAVNVARRAGCDTFIDAGSQAEYGRVNAKLEAETVCNPESGYGVAKYASGKLAFLAASELCMRSCHARILSTYGEGMAQNTLIIYLIKTLLDGKRPSLTKCEQMWDYMYVRDTASAFLALADGGVHGKSYPLGTGTAVQLREYIKIIRDMIDPKLELGFGEKEYFPHQPMCLCADLTELTRDTGFVPRYTFAEGISNTIKWVKTHQ